MGEKHNDLTEIIAQTINEMKKEQGEKFDLEKINLAELERRTGITRAKLRRLKSTGFVDQPHALTGRKAESTLLTGFAGIIDSLLQKGITNSSVCFDRIKENGFKGGLTIVKDYISNHKELVPPKRQLVAPQGSRGQRYQTNPGESYQMDWGFVTVATATGSTFKVACFAMICHCCGQRYIEFFPNAKQENLFIGMIHAFLYMGIPDYILTDNMKSVVIRRDDEGHPIWQKDYELFMGNIGFETKLCKPRHPFTKGAVERLARFVKDNFLPGRVFTEITDLNYEAIRWCNAQNGCYHRAVDCIPNEKHSQQCMKYAYMLDTMEGAYMESRKDNKGRVLRTGESQIKKTLAYMYRYKDLKGERKYIYDNDLNELRKKEKQILAELANGINRENYTLNQQIENYFAVKKKWDKSTRENYLYYYKHTIKNSVLGNMRVVNIKKTDVLLFYADCADNDMSNGTIAILHKIIHPAIELAVDDDIIRKNPSDGCTKEYPQKEEIKYALTVAEEKEYMDRIQSRKRMKRYYPLYAILNEVGLRISEAIGLTWDDVDFCNRILSVNHQLQYRSIEGKSVWYWKDATKTENGMREIPMSDKLYNLFREQQKVWLTTKKDHDFKVDGHSDFVFLSHMTGRPLYPANIRRMMGRIVEMNDCREIQLPDVSPHILRHTACTRFAESGMDIKVIQYIMGQVDVRTTMKCYNHVDRERAKRELIKFETFQNDLHQNLHQIM